MTEFHKNLLRAFFTVVVCSIIAITKESFFGPYVRGGHGFAYKLGVVISELFNFAILMAITLTISLTKFTFTRKWIASKNVWNTTWILYVLSVIFLSYGSMLNRY